MGQTYVDEYRNRQRRLRLYLSKPLFVEDRETTNSKNPIGANNNCRPQRLEKNHHRFGRTFEMIPRAHRYKYIVDQKNASEDTVLHNALLLAQPYTAEDYFETRRATPT